MTTTQRVMFFFVLPIIAVIFYPPQSLISGWLILPIVLVLFGLFGYLLLRGNSTVLTLVIFLQGMNVIIRLMMLFPHIIQLGGGIDFMYVAMNVLGIILSLYLLLRLDRIDVRATMVT